MTNSSSKDAVPVEQMENYLPLVFPNDYEALDLIKTRYKREDCDLWKKRGIPDTLKNFRHKSGGTLALAKVQKTWAISMGIDGIRRDAVSYIAGICYH